MKMTLAQAFDMINRGETSEQYERRIKKLRRLYDEMYTLQDAISLEWEDGDPRLAKKKARLEVVKSKIEELK